MKRVMAGLAFALTLIRILTAAASAQEYQTVSQLRESVPARWTTTIETKVARRRHRRGDRRRTWRQSRGEGRLRPSPLRSRRRKAAGRLLTIPTKRRAC